MENSRDSSSSSSLTSELQQGKDIARQLQILLNEPYSSNSHEIRGFLVHQIIESFSRAVSIAQQGDPLTASKAPSPLAMSRSDSPLSSQDPYPVGEDFRTRKALPRCKIKLQVSHETGFEEPPGDGYNWRKYGQKDILGASYPRSYYRCALSQQSSCPAKKQVQRTDEDPTIFEVSYRGLHTCTHHVSNPNLIPSSSSSHPQDQPLPQPPTQPPRETLISFKTTKAYQPRTIDFNYHHQLPCGTTPISFHGSSSATTTATSSAATTGPTSIASPTNLPIDHDLPFDSFDFDESEYFQ